jgi:hypothetical protein
MLSKMEEEQESIMRGIMNALEDAAPAPIPQAPPPSPAPAVEPEVSDSPIIENQAGDVEMGAAPQEDEALTTGDLQVGGSGVIEVENGTRVVVSVQADASGAEGRSFNGEVIIVPIPNATQVAVIDITSAGEGARGIPNSLMNLNSPLQESESEDGDENSDSDSDSEIGRDRKSVV